MKTLALKICFWDSDQEKVKNRFNNGWTVEIRQSSKLLGALESILLK